MRQRNPRANGVKRSRSSSSGKARGAGRVRPRGGGKKNKDKRKAAGAAANPPWRQPGGGGGGGGGGSGGGGGGGGAANPKGGGKGQKMSDGRWKASGGKQYCYAWCHRAGGCAQVCPNARVHSCEFCNKPHRTIECTALPAGWTPP